MSRRLATWTRISAARTGSPAGPSGLCRRRVLTAPTVCGVGLGDVADDHRGACPVGLEPARLDDDHLDAERRGLGPEHAAEAVDGELGGLVGGDAGRAADASAHGGELHDQAAALLAEHGDGRLGDVVDAPEVGLELGAEVRVGGGLDGRHVRVAGVVDDHVEAAERPRASAMAAAAAAGSVTSRAMGWMLSPYSAPRSASCSGRRAVAATRSPAFERGAHEGAAEAARGTGDEPDLFHAC